MSRGFTLIEVVVALLLLELGVVAAVGTLAVASRTLGEAERLERAVLASEGVLDSLDAVQAREGGSKELDAVRLEWAVDESGTVSLRATSPDSSVLVEVTSAVVGQWAVP